MNVQNDDYPAFPVVWQDIPHEGMTQRDWFAGQMAPAYLNCYSSMPLERIASAAYAMADALLAERNKETKT